MIGQFACKVQCWSAALSAIYIPVFILLREKFWFVLCFFMLLVETIVLGKTFRKSLRKSQTIKEVDEDQAKEQRFYDKPREEAAMFSRDSLEPEGWSFSFNNCFV